MPVESAQGGAHVDVTSVRLAFGERRVFDGLSCRFSQGKVSVILGASGVGKSTLLRLMAGLHRPDYGDIWIGEQEISRLSERQLRRVRRRIGMMFQGGALLDSMTVFDNVALALREHTKLGETEIADRVHAQFDAVGLKRVDALLPGELSGGMKKRAALARAMITEPGDPAHRRAVLGPRPARRAADRGAAARSEPGQGPHDDPHQPPHRLDDAAGRRDRLPRPTEPPSPAR